MSSIKQITDVEDDLELNQKKKRKHKLLEKNDKVDVEVEIPTYCDMLTRIFSLMPTLEFSKGHIPSPIISNRSRSTIFTNFSKICYSIKRDPKHVMQFIMSELQTTASQKDDGQLLCKGRFTSPQIQTILRKYVRTYVECKTCHCIDTKLSKVGNIYYINCNKCEAASSGMA